MNAEIRSHDKKNLLQKEGLEKKSSGSPLSTQSKMVIRLEVCARLA